VTFNSTKASINMIIQLFVVAATIYCVGKLMLSLFLIRSVRYPRVVRVSKYIEHVRIYLYIIFSVLGGGSAYQLFF